MLTHRARLPEFAHVYPVGALTVGLAGQRLTEMAELAEAGCASATTCATASRAPTW
jgi:dihydroorotase